MTGYLWGLLWSIELRFGVGLDVESVESRPVWTVTAKGLDTMPFSGLVIQIPFFTISIGNVYEEVRCLMEMFFLFTFLVVCLGYGINETINHWSNNDDTK